MPQLAELQRLLTPRSGISIQGFVNFIVRDVLENNDDACLVIVGYERSGKSNLARFLAREFSKRAKLPFSVKPIDPEGEGGNIQYPGQCFPCVEGGLRFLPRGSVFVSDESIASLFSRMSMKEEQMAFVQFLAMMGKRGIIGEYVSPDRRWNDVFMRGHRALHLFQARREYVRDPLGRLHARKGIADYYYREDMGNANPFAKFSWWENAGRFMFPGPDEDPQNEEYEYYSSIHKDAFAAGFEAPWKSFPWAKDRKPPTVDDMIPALEGGKAKSRVYWDVRGPGRRGPKWDPDEDRGWVM